MAAPRTSINGGRSAGRLEFYARAAKYFDRFLDFEDDDALGNSFAALVEGKNEVLCDPKMWDKFGCWLVYHAVQLANPNQRIQAAHAIDLLSALTTQAATAFPNHPTWSQSGFNRWYNELRNGVENLIKRREGSKGLKPPGATVALNKTAVGKLCNHFLEKGTSMSEYHRLVALLGYFAIGRGGESSQTTYERMDWSASYDTMELWWEEPKTLAIYNLTFFVDPESYSTCLFHAWSGYLLLNGPIAAAHVGGPHPLGDDVNWVFPMLAAREATASEAVTKILRDAAAEVDDWKDRDTEDITSKGLRRGGFDDLYLLFKMNPYPGASRGGWDMSNMSRGFKYFTLRTLPRPS